MGKEETKPTSLGVKVDAELQKRLRAASSQMSTPVTTIVTKLIEWFLEQEPGAKRSGFIEGYAQAHITLSEPEADPKPETELAKNPGDNPKKTPRQKRPSKPKRKSGAKKKAAPKKTAVKRKKVGRKAA